jgi:flagellar motor switch protein FliG
MSGGKIDWQNLSGVHKTAVFLLSMGENYTSAIFKTMNEDEITKVANAMAQLGDIPAEAVTSVSDEFVSIYENEDSLIVSGDRFLKKVLEKSMDKAKANKIFNEIEENKKEAPFLWSRGINTEILAGYLEPEHPQTVAMVLSNLPPDIAAEVLVAMPDDKKGGIALRIAQLGQVPEDIVRDVDEALREGLGSMGAGRSSGGINALVDIINNVDKATEDVVMELIEEEQSDMATDIRQLMFVFEDMKVIDDRGMREVLKKVESSQLTLALKTASEEMKQKILGNLSSRAAEMLMEDLEVMGPVKLSEVEEAQQEIVNAAKELEAEGTITIGGKGAGDILV